MYFPQLAAALLFFTGLLAHADDSLVVSDAIVMAAPPGVSVTAGFLSLDNRGDTAIVLKKVSAEGFDAVEIHKTQVQDGVARMLEQPSLTIAAHSQVLFEPGGFHLMLYQPSRPLRPGEQIPLQLYTSQGRLKVNAIVQKHDIF